MKRKEKPLRVEWWTVRRRKPGSRTAKWTTQALAERWKYDDEVVVRVEIYAVKGKK